jgi:hypothetical protein
MAAYRGSSDLGQLMGRTKPTPFTLGVVRETTGATAYWIPEAGPIPVSQVTLGSNLALPPLKLCTISVFDKELAKFATPSAERSIGDSLVKAAVAKTDLAFLDPAATAVAGTNPASVTSGGQTVITTGSTGSAIQNDRGVF